MTPETCPNCGEEVPPKAKACPGCGACEETGWSDDAYADRLGIPSENFNYEDYVKREFFSKEPKQKHGKLWALVAIILLATFVLAWVL
jgi:Fe-S oxidoreductase